MLHVQQILEILTVYFPFMDIMENKSNENITDNYGIMQKCIWQKHERENHTQ